METRSTQPGDSLNAHWLVRTSENLLHGPYTLEGVRSLIRARKVTALDEVCRGNHYWFYLHEDAEVKAQLGLEVPIFNPKRPRSDDGSTQTDTVSGEDERDTDRVFTSDEFPRARRAKVVHVRSQWSNERSNEPNVGRRPRTVEPTSFWRGIIWALAVLVIVLLYTVFRVLGSTGDVPRLPG